MRKLLIIAICLSVAGLSGVSLGAMYRPFFVWSSLEVTDQNDQTLFGNNPFDPGWSGQTGDIVQVLSVGLDGVISPPDQSGNPTGDDEIIYTTSIGTGTPWGYTGFGQFSFLAGRPFQDSEPALYTRIFNAPTIEWATHYGDSTAFTSLESSSDDFDVSSKGLSKTGTWFKGSPLSTSTLTPVPVSTPTAVPTPIKTPPPTPIPTVTPASTATPVPAPTSIHLVIAADDYSGNNRSDYALYRPSTGIWMIRNVTEGLEWGGADSDIACTGDYNGDGTADPAYFRDGRWSVVGITEGLEWGAWGDIPVPGDYDGDNTTDYAAWRPSDGKWRILYSGGGQLIQRWGRDGDIPVPGDYDSDGTTDRAVWRPDDHIWYIDGQAYISWGLSSDIPVPGDFDGDGGTDYTVWRPRGNRSGLWLIRGQQILKWGVSAAGDRPYVGDFSGDGAADAVIWRDSNARWLNLDTGGGKSRVNYGSSGDLPAVGAAH